jgi:hypothetical protein
VLDELRDADLYRRPTSTRDGRMFDDISGFPMATEFAISRFLVPHIAEGNGWALFITTPRGRNHVRSMLEMARKNPAWFAEVLTVDDTHQVTYEQIEEARTEYISLYGKEAADALIQQEYWCSFEAAILGAYYGKELSIAEQSGRITVVEHDATCPVHTAWDLGVDDAMAIWWFAARSGSRSTRAASLFASRESSVRSIFCPITLSPRPRLLMPSSVTAGRAHWPMPIRRGCCRASLILF